MIFVCVLNATMSNQIHNEFISKAIEIDHWIETRSRGSKNVSFVASCGINQPPTTNSKTVQFCSRLLAQSAHVQNQKRPHGGNPLNITTLWHSIRQMVTLSLPWIPLCATKASCKNQYSTVVVPSALDFSLSSIPSCIFHCNAPAKLDR